MKALPHRWHRLTVTTFAFLLTVPALPVQAADSSETTWREVMPGVLQSAGSPCAYALLDGRNALLIGAPNGVRLPDAKRYGVERWALVLLTHHHRDSCAGVAPLAAAGIPVRAPSKSELLLAPKHVREYWKAALPIVTPGRFPPLFERSWNRWSYLVHPTGIEGLRYDLEDGQTIAWHDWMIEVLATPGHSPDHLSLRGPAVAAGHRSVIAFCGDAFCQPGKIWSPYTTDWHHVQSDGLQAAATSLDRLANCKPDLLCPEHGPVMAREINQALTTTAAGLRRAALLKSYERYTKETPGQPIKVAWLAPDQVGSANPLGNPKPWTKLSPHLYLTGNTYALASKEGPVLLVDPYAQNLVQRLEELRRDHGVGPAETVLISHAHNDHYTGIFALPRREQFQVWTLDRIADVIGNPVKYRAPYVDARVVKTDRRLEAGQSVTWREYGLKIHHQPGQTVFAMGVEVVVDGKRCLFTGDNFYRADQYSGSGGWSGLNRGLPGGYVQTIRQVMALRPDWVLAEHGGAFEYQAEDFRRRLRWAEEAVAAADGLSPSGQHAVDWDPHRIRVEPVLVAALPGRSARVQVVVTNPTSRERRCKLRFARPDIARTPDLDVTVLPRSEVRREVEFSVSSKLGSGRHVIPCVAAQGDSEDGSDAFVILEIE